MTELRTKLAFALFEPEDGIDLESIRADRAEVEREVTIANAAVLTSHGHTPYVCRPVVVHLAEESGQ